ncbi:MAG: Fis family transcriptional regulator [Syntrophobacterales bacterium CG03_land_8_20_14_0_80_58_14]|nr:MAG: Fis family transcriptional regulator [Syntrophobacterales bacterium CG03_land_8_20_14_0_80_58_14]
MAKILVVDDDQGMREFLEIMMTREGYRVVTASDAGKALARCRKETFDLVITDLKMPKMDGIAFLKEVKQLSPETMVILITAYASGGTAVNAMKEGAYDYIEKDFAIEDLKRIVRDALAKKGVNRDDALFLKEGGEAVRFGNMIGSSPEMLKVYATIKKVADTPANVLILGESGTGKELVARSIHENSSRRKMPFLVINCGGISENLLESELFGYIKGAFTGAYTDKGGLFKAARGGTIFLDEIAELPPPLQVKLLRVVQEKTFRRIGGAKDIQVDVRIISATHQNLADNVKTGTFREDLYYRLNVIPLQLPPLRGRKEDIPILTKHFIEKYSREFGKEIITISAYALELLMEYPFPGNIRELQNIIERSVALETSNIILPENLILSKEISGEEEKTIPALSDDGLNLNGELAIFEKRLIEKALEKASGSKSRAAELLKISYDSLHYRSEKLGIH